jgi:AraC-like DNA-binding protein
LDDFPLFQAKSGKIRLYLWLKKDYAMNKLPEQLYREIENPLSIVNAKDEFVILDNPVLSPHASYPYKNDWIIATLCEQGSAKGKVNLREYNIESNGFIIILPGQVIGGSELSPDFKGKMIMVSPRFAEGINLGASLRLTKSVERKPYYLFPDEAALAFRNFIELCKSLILLKEDSNILEELQVLARGFFMGMEAFITHQEPLPKLAEGHSSDLAEAFLNLVEVEYRHHRDLSYYANKLCKSTKYLSRVIMKATGRSATDWIERCVIMDAKAQLTSTQKRVSEISDDLSFTSPSFFGKYFKRLTGLSPRAFREADTKWKNLSYPSC